MRSGGDSWNHLRNCLSSGLYFGAMLGVKNCGLPLFCQSQEITDQLNTDTIYSLQRWLPYKFQLTSLGHCEAGLITCHNLNLWLESLLVPWFLIPSLLGIPQTTAWHIMASCLVQSDQLIWDPVRGPVDLDYQCRGFLLSLKITVALHLKSFNLNFNVQSGADGGVLAKKNPYSDLKIFLLQIQQIVVMI